MLFFLGLIGVAVLAALIFRGIRSVGSKALTRRFQQFQDDGNLNHLMSWLAENESSRMIELLEFLEAHEAYEVASDIWYQCREKNGRSVRLTMLRMLSHLNNDELAVPIAQQLLNDYPNDDAVLDAYFGALLDAGHHSEVKPRLEHRISQKVKGTAFQGHLAHLLALEGKKDEARVIWQAVELQQRNLAINTLAPATKKLLQQQHHRTREKMSLFDIRWK